MSYEAKSVEKYVHACPKGATAKSKGLLCCYPARTCHHSSQIACIPFCNRTNTIIAFSSSLLFQLNITVAWRMMMTTMMTIVMMMAAAVRTTTVWT